MVITDEKSWSKVQNGMEIPVLIKTPSPMQLFMFSASTWNRHLIHYNSEFAARDGFAHLAVHRALIGGYLAQMLSDWVGDRGFVKKIAWTVRGSAVPGEPIKCGGKVVSVQVQGRSQLV